MNDYLAVAPASPAPPRAAELFLITDCP